MTSFRPPGIPDMTGKSTNMGRIRPQVLLAIGILGLISIIGIFKGLPEISGVAAAGIIALAKDVITTDGS
jgi:hypothetical protein